jgi:magnesium chelatase subunit D
MTARAVMAHAKGAVLGLLAAAYRRRDRLGLVAFHGDRAVEAVPPTPRLAALARTVAGLPAGGRTPLPEALRLAAAILSRPAHAGARRSVWVVTDGRPNVAGRTPLEARRDAHTAAARLRRLVDDATVVDAESGTVRLGLARILAEALGATYVRLDGPRPAPPAGPGAS